MIRKFFIGIVILVGVILTALAFPNQTSYLKHEISIHAPVSDVYRVLAQIDNVDEWVAPVKKAEYISDTKFGVGSARKCEFEDGSFVEEAVTEAIENQLIKMEMTKHDLPVEYFRWKIFTQRDGAQEKTMVIQLTEYKVKMGLIGSLMDVFWVRPNMEKTLNEAYSSLKDHIESKKL